MSEPFPEYTASYPLLHTDDVPGVPGHRSSIRVRSITPDKTPTQPSIDSGKASPSDACCQSAWSDLYSRWKSGKCWPTAIGCINLRVGSYTLNPRNDQCVRADTIGEEAISGKDAPAAKRRATNMVDWRLRLWVRWVSLARLLDHHLSFSGGARKETVSAGEKINAGSEVSRANVETSACERSSPIKEYTTRARRNNPPIPPTSSPCYSLECRVFWFGLRITSFELHPETGLPMRPGECLLPLPRGVAWSACSLRLEVVRRTGNDHMGSGFGDSWKMNYRRDPCCGDGFGGNGPARRSGTSSMSKRHSVLDKEPEEVLLGVVVINWKVKNDEGFVLENTTLPGKPQFAFLLPKRNKRISEICVGIFERLQVFPVASLGKHGARATPH